MNKFSKLSIVVPCFNEEESVPLFYAETIKQDEFFKSKNVELEFIFVNDGSTDGTEKVCRQNQFRHISLPVNLGLTGAVRKLCMNYFSYTFHKKSFT